MYINNIANLNQFFLYTSIVLKNQHAVPLWVFVACLIGIALYINKQNTDLQLHGAYISVGASNYIVMTCALNISNVIGLVSSSLVCLRANRMHL